MPGGKDDGGSAGNDPVDMSSAVETARQHVQELERRLEELQKQRLARGTRDILEKAREAARKVAEDVGDDN